MPLKNDNLHICILKNSREFLEKKTGTGTGIDQRDSQELPFPEFP